MKLINFIKIKIKSKFLFKGLIFILGLIIGYVLGFYRVLQPFFIFIKNIHFSIPSLNINLSSMNI